MPMMPLAAVEGSARQYFWRSFVKLTEMIVDFANLPAAALAAQDSAIAAVFRREARRLRAFIRRRVADACDAEDIAQDVFSELIEATRLAAPIENVGAWLSRVAANRITDRFRRKAAGPFDVGHGDASEAQPAEERVAPAQIGPEAHYANRRLLDTIEAALAELPPEQRDVFIAHELEGQSFKSLAAASGVGVNTLLSRKRHAVLHLRSRLQGDHHEPSNREE